MTTHVWTQDIYTHTYRFAAEAHLGQKYPGTEISYLMHLSFVCMEIILGLTDHTDRDGNLAIQCALLHDTIEDTAVTFTQIESKFGNKVAQGVLALTKDTTLPKEAQMTDSLARIQAQPYEIWMVKLADRITNLAPPPHYWNTEKIRRYQKEAIQIHENLHPASDYLGKRLEEKIAQYEIYM